MCTRVVRPVVWWDVIGRLMSDQVGSSRYKSGQSGRYFFLALFCCYAFASVFPLLESVPGSGKFTTTYADARLTPVIWRLGWQSVVFGRLMSGQVDPSRSRSIQVVWFSFFLAFVWLGLRAVGHWFVVAVLGGSVMGGRFVGGIISRIWWVFWVRLGILRCLVGERFVNGLSAVVLGWRAVKWGG